ncbi:hypothetical protein ULMS_07070 [Patiriisocius marinistellae]|uniref:Peptidase S74 domain-containing protein n=1 Tax=Patiriisocius marinistellae TaxID=2494560 RepID=A0A5J4FYG1_9FLAO|nr:tail fiber domain-containing protein [Patiriisocius marinistellae]GEQ85199.1 hypothetical protein ULMS_07070 [Patiriisocius marinistellae]
MKQQLLFIITLFISAISIAQNGINYKAQITDNDGSLITNQSVIIQFTILKNGTINVYQESHNPTTDDNGIIRVLIGQGTYISGDAPEWNIASHSLNVKMDIGAGFVDLGTEPFGTVPYALHATNINGLEALDEGNGKGWRLIGHSADNYGNIGKNAVDLSRSSMASSLNGATGNNSFTVGQDTRASALGSIALGFNNEATGNSATAIGLGTKADAVGSVAVGTYNTGGGDSENLRDSNPIFQVGNGLSSSTRSNAFTILQDGTIGIGKHTDINGMLEIEGNSSSNSPQLSLVEDNSGYARIKFKNTNRNGEDYWDLAAFIGENTADDRLNLFNSDGGNIFTVSGDGKVGINDSNPSKSLDINGDLKVDEVQITTGAANGYILTSDSEGNATWQAPTGGGGGSSPWTVNGNDIYFNNNGNGLVGIGTNDPGRKLHVVGNSRFEGNIWANSTSEILPALRGISIDAPGITGTSTNGYGIEGYGGKGAYFVGYTGDGIDVDTNAPNTNGLHSRAFGENSTGVWGISAASTGAGIGVRGSSSSPDGFSFYANGQGVMYGQGSSIRWKSNIVEIDNALEKLSKIRGVYYDLDEEHGGKHDMGMIAEEVGAVLPEIVAYEENGIDAIGMDYGKMTPLLVQVAKEQQQIIEEERAKVDNLKQQLQEMTGKFETLENRLSALENNNNFGNIKTEKNSAEE